MSGEKAGWVKSTATTTWSSSQLNLFAWSAIICSGLKKFPDEFGNCGEAVGHVIATAATLADHLESASGHALLDHSRTSPSPKMAFQALVNGADCGPSTALQNLGKQFDRDRGVQQVCKLLAQHHKAVYSTIVSLQDLFARPGPSREVGWRLG